MSEFSIDKNYPRYEAAFGSEIYGPEYNLHTSDHGKACPKYPGHRDFIPIKEFTLDHLPDLPGKVDYFNNLMLQADRVVHIIASEVSPERPKEFPLHKQMVFPRNGSGHVLEAMLCGPIGQGETPQTGLDRFLKEPCTCCDCRRSGDPKTLWWMVRVGTAAHVIFDDKEADGSRVSLFYDEDGTRTVTMRGIDISGVLDDCQINDPSVKANRDYNTFFCSLHDLDVGERLRSNIKSARRLVVKEAGGPFPSSIIAHPHGSSKHICFGRYDSSIRNLRGDPENVLQFTYHIPTCPGSSGGLVTMGGEELETGMYCHSKAESTHLSQSSWAFYE